MRSPRRGMGGTSDRALSSKPSKEEWLPDTLIVRMTFPVQFVDIFLVSLWCSLADTDSVKPV